MESIFDMDQHFRDDFEKKRMSIFEIALLVESVGLRDCVQEVYTYYEGADYIGIETYNIESLKIIRNKLDQIMGKSSINCIFELNDGTMNAFYRYEKYPLFSLRLSTDPEEFPINDILPGSKIIKKDGFRYEVVKK